MRLGTVGRQDGGRRADGAHAGRRYFEFVALPGQVLGLVALVLAAYFLAAEVAKRPFFRPLDV